jgi:hypothetical protein
MPQAEPLDFLVARAAALCAQAAVLRDANARRHQQAEQTIRRANVARLRARLFAAAAADLVHERHTLRRNRPLSMLDAAARARLAADELWRRRLQKRLWERSSG